MPLQAQRPAPPPPGPTNIQQKKSNLNSSIRSIGSNDSNNNKQTSLLSRPTVIRPSAKPSNKFTAKKKPPPRPAPPKNYQASKRTADPFVSSTPDLLADLQDIFSGRQVKATQSQTSSQKQSPAFFFDSSNHENPSFPFVPSSQQTNPSFPFKPSGQQSNPSFPFKPPSQQPASAFPFKPPNQQSTSHVPVRPSSKKYQAPVPSVVKSKSSAELSLIDFDSPVSSSSTSRIPQSFSFATASTTNSLLDFDMGPAQTNMNQQRPGQAKYNLGGNASLLDLPIPSVTAQDVSKLAKSPGAKFAKQQVSSMSAQQKETAVNWAMDSAKHQTVSTQQKETAVNWAMDSVKHQNVNAQQKETAVNWAVSSVKKQNFSTHQKEMATNWALESVKQQSIGRERSPPEPKFPPPPPPPETAFDNGTAPEICEVLFEFVAEKAGDLPLQVGDKVEVELKQNQDWWTGHCNGRTGIFPASFVQPLSAQQQVMEQADSSTGCFAKALFNFTVEDQTDLPFQEGDIVQVLYRINQDWLFGSCQGREGQFPASFVQKMTPQQAVCRAIYEFQAENHNELSFNPGEQIIVIEKTSTDWWKGKKESDPSGKAGMFPAAFVESICN